MRLKCKPTENDQEKEKIKNKLKKLDEQSDENQNELHIPLAASFQFFACKQAFRNILCGKRHMHADR